MSAGPVGRLGKWSGRAHMDDGIEGHNIAM